MNSSYIRYILSMMMKIEGGLLLVPALVGFGYNEYNIALCYLLVAAFCEACGLLFGIKKVENQTLYMKDGCIATGACWILLSFFGALPFVVTKEIPNIFDALFESVSGFTTTGATILSDVEAVSHASLFWRSFTHWIGGMGILVFILAIIPLSGGSNLNLMRAESTGASVGKLMPKIKSYAGILYIIYAGLTLMEFILLLIAKMPAFDAVNIAMATAGTGGFGVLNDSVASYSVAAKWVCAIFMFLFGVNFYLYYYLLFRKFRKAFHMEEVRIYFGIILFAIIAITWNILNMYGSFFEALTDSVFQVATIISSTGFATADFDLWPQQARLLLMMLTFIGSCAGSTGGGMKVSRVTLLVKTIRKELTTYIHPKSVKKIHMEGKPIEHEVQRSINVYFVTYMVIFVASALLLSFHGDDHETILTSVTACMNNTGPGLSKVGPTCNYGFYSWWAKCILMFDMLAGRLELFPLLILFHPTVWKDLLERKKDEKEFKKKTVE